MSQRQLRVYVDERERASNVPQYLSKMGIYVLYKQLSVGDYLVGEEVVIERKSVEDLVKSVFDGRLFEQAKRLSEAYTTPIIIVEGDLGKISFITSRRKQVNAALTAVSLDYNIRILYSASVKESAELIALIARKAQSSAPTRMVIHKKPRLSSITEWQLYIAQSLPYVGPRTALRLLERFGTLERIFTASASELSKIEGIGDSKARMIVRILKTPFSPSIPKKREVSLDEFS